MIRSRRGKPTAAELEILRVLWQRGPSTVREVQETLGTDRTVGYTTVLKTLQIMSEKDLVSRDERARAHVYAPRAPRETTERQLVADLLDRAFGGSTTRLVLQALASRRTPPKELARIRRFLDELERKEDK